MSSLCINSSTNYSDLTTESALRCEFLICNFANVSTTEEALKLPNLKRVIINNIQNSETATLSLKNTNLKTIFNYSGNVQLVDYPKNLENLVVREITIETIASLKLGSVTRLAILNVLDSTLLIETLNFTSLQILHINLGGSIPLLEKLCSCLKQNVTLKEVYLDKEKFPSFLRLKVRGIMQNNQTLRVFNIKFQDLLNEHENDTKKKCTDMVLDFIS